MKKNLPKIILALLFIGVIGFVIFAMLSPEKSDNSATKTNNRPAVPADTAKLSDGNYLGPVDAKVTVTEFGDYQCPFCKDDNSIIKDDIMVTYNGKIKFVFLNFPLTERHKNSQAAAQAAEAAGLQGKFWQMHDLLYEKQSDWEKLNDPTKKFEEYAKQVGVDINQFQQDYASQKVADIINNQAALGEAFAVSGTPTYFVNGVKVNGRTDPLKQAIEKALAQ